MSKKFLIIAGVILAGLAIVLGIRAVSRRASTTENTNHETAS
jgi:hypothetical protein